MGKKNRLKKVDGSKNHAEKPDNPRIHGRPSADSTNVHKTRLRTWISSLMALSAIGIGAAAISGNSKHDERGRGPMVMRIQAADQSKIESQTQRQERFWATIKKVEDGIRALEQKINFDIPKDEKIRRDLPLYFQVIKNNQEQNPQRNSAALGKKGARIQINHFFYEFGDLESSGKILSTAAFDVIQRTMTINADFDPNDPIDIMTIFHESIHAADDTNMHKAYLEGKFPQYEKFTNGSERNFINSEVKAFIYQIELLNALLNDMLRSEISKGINFNSPEALEAVAKTLNLEKSRHAGKSKIILRDMLLTAQIYYETGAVTDGMVSEEFYREVFERYKNQDMLVYENDGNLLETKAGDYEGTLPYGRRILN